eukprot:scaffold235489_cov31-Attheya_sp.AAC.2
MSSDEESSNKENDEEEQNQAASGGDGDDYARIITINDTLICRITALNRVVDEKAKIIASKEKLEKELYKQIDEQGDELRLERIEKKKLFNSTTIESNEIMYDRVSTYVRRHIFSKVKFTHDKALDSVSKGTMGYTVANAFNALRDQLIPWWQTYKQGAHTGIAQTRNGKITELKKAFISKCQKLLQQQGPANTNSHGNARFTSRTYMGLR